MIRSQQNALKILLTEYNPAYDLLCASSYAEGLDLLSHSDISLFLLDVELNPCDRTDTKDGVELARQIRQHPEYLHTPIIFLTSIPERILEALNQTHCFDYLLKPYDRGMLYHCLIRSIFREIFPNRRSAFLTRRASISA
ncbi:MAG: response regulator [Lachnospiraceae bacterium]